MNMPIQEWFSVASDSGDVRVYSERPASTVPLPVVLILHSVIGLDDFVRKLIRQYAEEGYWAVVPDIYSNDDEYRTNKIADIELASHISRDPAQRDLALAAYPIEQRPGILKAWHWIVRRPTETYIDTVRAVFSAVHSREEAGRIGAIGFCMGGRLVGELAEITPELAAGVIHYGRPPKIELVQQIHCPLQGHYASRDTNITGKVPAFADAMSKAGKNFSYYIYEADHGFSLAPHLEMYNPDAARISLDRSNRFLREHLKP